MELRVLSSGIDSLDVSVRGTVRTDLWDVLEDARQRAQDDGPVPVELGDTGQAFEVLPHGWRCFPLWLRSPDYQLMLGRSEAFPAAVAQLGSAYLHSMGAGAALRLVEQALRRAVLVGMGDVTVSRLDLYADVQGWDLEVDDFRRFVSRARNRTGLPLGEDDGPDRFWALGRKLTGFAFGQRGAAVYCRIYDKTTEIRRRGLSWLPDLWGERELDVPVWRVEFELRRPVLVQHGLRTVDEVLAGVQDLWRYATIKWLTYRERVADARERRWPVDSVWEQVQAIRLASNELGVVRGRVDEATEEQLVMGATGYLSSLAAFHRWRGGVTQTMERVGPILVRYLESRGRTWEALVAWKAAQRMSVSGWAEDVADAEEEAA